MRIGAAHPVGGSQARRQPRGLRVGAALVTVLIVVVGLWQALLGAMYSGEGHDATDRGTLLNTFAWLGPLIASAVLVAGLWLAVSERMTKRRTTVTIACLLIGAALLVGWWPVMTSTT
jgi:hypothetical protein